MSDKVTPTPPVANMSAVVLVGCKLPNGLICEMGRPGEESYARVVLNGANHSRVVGGFGLTEVSKNFWEAWHKKHKHLDFVRKGMVFMHVDMASAVDYAKERAEIRTGLEPLDPLKGMPKDVEVDKEHFNQARRAAAEAGAVRVAG